MFNGESRVKMMHLKINWMVRRADAAHIARVMLVRDTLLSYNSGEIKGKTNSGIIEIPGF